MGTGLITSLLRTLIVLFAAAASAGAFAAPSAPMTISAAVLQPLSIVKVSDMRFGSIVPSTAAGTVVLSPSTGTVTHTGGVLMTTGATGYAQFEIDAQGATTANVNWQANITLTNASGNTMTVNPITQANNAVVCGVGLCFPSGNILQINFGGTLNVAANQPVGAYTGTFTVTAAFQ